MSKRKSSDLDVIVGKNIKFYRALAGLSQTQLGDAMDGITFQQVQKFEHGTNRVSSVQLVKAARALGVTVVDLLDGVADELPPGHSVTRGEVRLLADYKKLTPDMQASMRQFIGAIVQELANNLGGKR